MPTSFSVPALHTNPYSHVSSDKIGKTEEPVRPRRLGQAQRIRVTHPMDGEEGDQEHEQREYGRELDREGPLRGAVRLATAGMGGLGKKAGLGRAERRIVTAPLATATGAATNGALEGGAVRLRKKEHDIAATGQEQANYVSTTHVHLSSQQETVQKIEPGVYHHQPEPQQQHQGLFSPVVVHILKKNADSPLLPVLMGSRSRSQSTSSTPSLENQLPPTTSTPSIAHPSILTSDLVSPLKRENVSEAEAQEEVKKGQEEEMEPMKFSLKEVYPLTPPSMKPSSEKKEELELAKWLELPASPKPGDEEDGRKERREDKDSPERKEKGRQQTVAPTSALTTASIPAPALTTTSVPVPPPSSASTTTAPPSRKPLVPIAASSRPLNPRPRVISGSSISTKPTNKPSKPIVRKAFRPISSTSFTSVTATGAASAGGSGKSHLTAATMASRAKAAATASNKPAVVSSSTNANASSASVGGAAASSTEEKTANAQCSTRSSSTTDLTKVKEKGEMMGGEPVRRVGAKKAATAVPARARQPSTSTIIAASTSATATNGQANPIPARKPPVPSHVTFPPTKKERIKLKVPLPSFRPARSRPAVAAPVAACGTEVKGQNVRGKEASPEMIRLPDTPSPEGEKQGKRCGTRSEDGHGTVKLDEVRLSLSLHEVALPETPEKPPALTPTKAAFMLEKKKEMEEEKAKSPASSSTQSIRLLSLRRTPQSPIKMEKGRPASPLLTTGAEEVDTLLESSAEFEDGELSGEDKIKGDNQKVAENEDGGEEEMGIVEADEMVQTDERKQDRKEHLAREDETDLSRAPSTD